MSAALEGLKPVMTYVDLPQGYEVLRDPGTGRYSVVTPEGDVIGAHSTLDLAERSAERQYRKAKEKERKCIVPECNRLFMSSGPGHRMCGTCRIEKTDMSGGC